MPPWDRLARDLRQRESEGLLRRLMAVESPPGPRIRIEGRDCVCLGSNDYLCLAADPRVREAAERGLRRWGLGSGASRLVCGSTQAHRDLERQIARFEGREAAVVTSSGWGANRAAVEALAGRGDLVLCDKLDHASILDAALAGGATVRTYPHGDLTRAEKLLERLRGRSERCVLITDGLFSMDGDLAPLAGLVELKTRYDAVLVVDEAHATGTLGANGRGAAEALGCEAGVDVTVGTLSKALGGLGGFVAGPAALIETIVNGARSFIYTTALPAAICEAAREALRIVRDEPRRRQRLAARAEAFRARLAERGLNCRPSASHIVPVRTGTPGETLAVAGKLLEAGFFVPAIRPPTVPPGTSRLRCSLCCEHEEGDLDRLADAIADGLKGC